MCNLLAHSRGVEIYTGQSGEGAAKIWRVLQTAVRTTPSETGHVSGLEGGVKCSQKREVGLAGVAGLPTTQGHSVPAAEEGVRVGGRPAEPAVCVAADRTLRKEMRKSVLDSAHGCGKEGGLLCDMGWGMATGQGTRTHP